MGTLLYLSVFGGGVAAVCCQVKIFGAAFCAVVSSTH